MHLLALSIVVFSGAVMCAMTEIAIALTKDQSHTSSLDDLGALIVIGGLMLFLHEYFRIQPLVLDRRREKAAEAEAEAVTASQTEA